MNDRHIFMGIDDGLHALLCEWFSGTVVDQNHVARLLIDRAEVDAL